MSKYNDINSDFNEQRLHFMSVAQRLIHIFDADKTSPNELTEMVIHLSDLIVFLNRLPRG